MNNKLIIVSHRCRIGNKNEKLIYPDIITPELIYDALSCDIIDGIEFDVYQRQNGDFYVEHGENKGNFLFLEFVDIIKKINTKKLLFLDWDGSKKDNIPKEPFEMLNNFNVVTHREYIKEKINIPYLKAADHSTLLLDSIPCYERFKNDIKNNYEAVVTDSPCQIQEFIKKIKNT